MTATVGTRTQQGGFRLPYRARRATVAVHIIVSVGALGVYAAMLAMAIAAALSDNPETVRADYRAMGVFADYMIIPMNVLVLGTGLLLAFGTPFGLFRYWWVTLKFGLSVFLAAGSIFGMRLRIQEAIDEVAANPNATGIGAEGVAMVLLLLLAVSIYTVNTILSYYKPFGLIRKGHRRPR